MNVHCETLKIINRHSTHVHVYCDESEFLYFESEMFLGKLCQCTLQKFKKLFKDRNCLNVHVHVYLSELIYIACEVT